MSITPEQVIAAFQVTGSTPDDITYTRVLTNELAPIPLIVSNSGTFTIRFFPTASVGITFKTEDNALVDNISPITLAPSSGSKIFATIDTSTFDNETLLTKTYDIGFNMVAITASFSFGIGNDTSPNLPTDAAPTGSCTPSGQVPTALNPCCPGLAAVSTPPTFLPVCR